jgi:hypothetical protein
MHGNNIRINGTNTDMTHETRKSAAKTAAKKKPRVDWDAVERDYRTDKFTLRELASKYAITHTTISRRAEKLGWAKDLTEAIRQATNAKLVQQSVQQQCTSAHQHATDAVLAAAELNSRIIQSHRTKLAALHEMVEAAKNKVTEIADGVADIREAATFAQAVGNLATATKTLIEQERKAHNLDADTSSSAGEAKRVIMDFVEAVRQ